MSAEGNTHYPIVEAAIETIVDWVNRYRALSGGSGLGECDSREVARIASDLGITAADLRDLAEARPGSADLLQEMLPALGVDPKTLAETDPLMMRDLQRLCVTCRNKNRCRRELDELSAAEHYHHYCPNAVTIDALLGERGN